jgi:hypothetical protein
MTLEQLQQEIEVLIAQLEAYTNIVGKASTVAQRAVYQLLQESINQFEQSNGRFVVGSPYVRTFLSLDRDIDDILDRIYRPAVREYLNGYKTIDEVNAGLQKSYNDIDVDVKKLSSARQVVYKQAETALLSAIDDTYKKPAQYILMQQVATGASVKDAQRILKNWDEGKLTDGRLLSGQRAPALERYSTQIARDAIFKANSAVNNVIAQEYGLTHFTYVGDLIKDSRPLCRHLVGLRRKISIDEIPPLVQQFPQGLYPNTTRENFIEVCGGYSCRHIAMPVKPNKRSDTTG